MSIIKIFKTKKLFLFNIFLTLYIGINLLSGERGLISYFDKKNIEKELIQKASNLTEDLNFISNKNRLLSKNIDIDFLDSLYREKLKFGKKNEILIKLK